MKVVMLTQTYPRFEGDTAGTFIRSIAETLAARGDEVHVLLPWDRAFEGSRASGGVELHTFRYAPSDGWHVMGYSRTMQADVGLKRSAYLLAPAFALAGWRGLRRLVARVRPDVVNAHWLVPNGVIAALAGVRPTVVSLHGSDVFVAERRSFRWLAARALAHADALTGSSQDLVDRATAVHPMERARFIPYGVDPARFDGRDERAAAVRRELGVADDELLILAVGRVVPKKGFDVLVEALGLMESGGWRAVIAGAGQQLAALRARGQALGLASRLGFPGEVAHDALPAWYSAADIFVMPSVRDFAGNIDGLPNVVLEAMASERAIVASEVAGIPSVVLEGQTGLLVPERDAQRLAQALERLLRRGEERRMLGRAARQKVLAELTWEAVAARYRQVYVEAGAAP